MLSGISANDFAVAVNASDAVTLTRLPGVGKKTAERLVVEMRDRLAAPALAAGAAVGSGAEQEAFAAMIKLGYKPAESQKLINAASKPGMTSEQLIRAALQAALRK